MTRRISFLVLALVILAAPSVFAWGGSIVSPVDPNPVNYDGQCAINSVSHWTIYNWGDWSDDYGSVDYSCSGTFRGEVEVEIHFEYTLASGAAVKYTQAPMGFSYQNYYAPNIPSWGSHWTTAPRNPDYLTRTVATIRWAGPWTCTRYYCGQQWYSTTSTSGWFN